MARKSSTLRSSSHGLASADTASLRRELERRAQNLDALLARRDQIASEMAALESEIEALGGSPSTAPRGRRGAPPGRRRHKNAQTLSQALAAVLKDKTMSVKDAAQAVRDAGYKTTSRSFYVQVITALTRGGFRKVARGRYTAR